MDKRRPPETRDQAIRRLAAVAEERGIRIYAYPLTGEHYATSASTPGLLHRVTLLSCDCPGYFRNGRCTHHSALLAELDQLPPLPDPSTPEAMTARRAERVQDWRANNEAHARRWLTSLIAKQEAGDLVAERDLQEAAGAVAQYAAASASSPAALAA